jgi:DNA cross-link repair 1A protein
MQTELSIMTYQSLRSRDHPAYLQDHRHSFGTFLQLSHKLHLTKSPTDYRSIKVDFELITLRLEYDHRFLRTLAIIARRCRAPISFLATYPPLVAPLHWIMARKTPVSTPKTKSRPNGTPSKKPPLSTPKPPAKPNASILNFFKKEPVEPDLFVQGRYSAVQQVEDDLIVEDVWEESSVVKKRRLGGAFRPEENAEGGEDVLGDCTPPPKENVTEPVAVATNGGGSLNPPDDKPRRNGPFLDDVDSEAESEEAEMKDSNRHLSIPKLQIEPFLKQEDSLEDDIPVSSGDFEGFEGIEDFDEDDIEQGEEYQERKWSKTQQLLELGQNPGGDSVTDIDLDEIRCPLCNFSLQGMSAQEASVHVNGCLDGDQPPRQEGTRITELMTKQHRMTVFRPPRPGQKDPVAVASTKKSSTSAFSKIMSSHAEDAAWATAAASEVAARGKPSYQRTCPFYKILPGLSICVDAFRYGAVEGCNAYFLSHFHSDHYVGLTSTWCHGPIYCSKVTANLVRQQLNVAPKWVVPLEYEVETEVPNTNGVKVTMIPANHCPGSSLFLYEKTIGQGKNPRIQRILHCGDFRACKAHLEHSLLMPTIVDEVTKKARQQRIDICYLDTTYLNPKYAFPSQEAVIQACADLCVNLNNNPPSDLLTLNNTESTAMKAFLQNDPSAAPTTVSSSNQPPAKPSRLLVVIGTYSIGKERICIGVAKALHTKIYAPPSKIRICTALEDPTLSALLTPNPLAAQVHMTPLFDLQAPTLDDYLSTLPASGGFTHAVGFRPTGWSYRPPGGRLLDNPSVSAVLHGGSWRSRFGVQDMMPQRGSTKRAACYGVPYSEHSSFRELAAFVCALRIDRVIPTVNVGSARSREKMRMWVEKWTAEKKKNGLFKAEDF